MIVHLENGEIVEDGYYPYDPYRSYGYVGYDSGIRSKENDTSVRKQATLSRLDEVKFFDIIGNKDYYMILPEEPRTRCYFICMRCGYVPESKIDKENTIYLDMHCKCGNATQYADFTEEEIDKMIEDRCISERYSKEMREAMGVLGW